MPKLAYHERPSDASVAFLRRLVDRAERFDRLHDCLDLIGYRYRDSREELAAFVLRNMEYRPAMLQRALAHPDEFAALIDLCRWYHRLTKKGRALAYADIERATHALPPTAAAVGLAS